MLEFNLVPDEITPPELRPIASSVPKGTVWKDIHTGSILVSGANAWFDIQDLDPVTLLTTVGLLNLSGGGSGITGSGTSDYIPVWTAASTQGDASINMSKIQDGTEASILFIGSSEVLSQNSQYQFFPSGGGGVHSVISESNRSRGVWLSSGGVLIHNQNGNNPAIEFFTANGGTFDPSNGDVNIDTVTSANQSMGRIAWAGYTTTGTPFSEVDVAKIEAVAEDTFSDIPTYSPVSIRFSNAPGGNFVERFRITPVGTTGITSPDAASNIIMAGQVELQGAVVLMANLPTSDPVKAGQLWSNLGIVTVSAGT